MSKLEVLLGRLEKVKGRNGSFVACCPHHADKSPSLALKENPDGRILLHCFAGCSAAEVVGSIGMELGDLFPEDAQRERIGHRGQPTKPRFYATDLLKIINFEALVVSIAAADMSRGKPLSDVDKQRLSLAADRIREAATYAG